jgi:D-beta-D-heptose 7-phosphate kinase / D-beta-D-heptose 1-phosphate adenosyltransferase
MNDLLQQFDALGRPQVLVIGDVMLDRYTTGDVDRLSPEAPVPILHPENDDVRLGGAASVAALLRGLEAQVMLVGVVGADGTGTLVRRLVKECGVCPTTIVEDAERPTTEKTRLLGRAEGKHTQQLLRIDRESLALVKPNVERELIRTIQQAALGADLILISDYGKGVCTPRLLRHVRRIARQQQIPVFVDPARHATYERYRGFTAVVPNRVEAEQAVGQLIPTPADGLAVAETLRLVWGFETVVVKLDRDGMVVASPESSVRAHLPAQARTVFDVTGAGDMVLAMLGVARASGLSWSDSAALANVAAALEVERHGVQIVSRDEIRRQLIGGSNNAHDKITTLHELTLLRETYRQDGRCVVLTNGCFDLLHPGHVTHLEQAAELGDVLIVAINSDSSVFRLKGPDRPLVKQSDRTLMLAALACVDHVLVFDQDTPHQLLWRLKPDVLCKGGDYAGPDEVVGHEVVAAYGGQVLVTRKISEVSTTKLAKALARPA